MDEVRAVLRRSLNEVDDHAALALVDLAPQVGLAAARRPGTMSLRSERRQLLPKLRKHLKGATDDDLDRLARAAVPLAGNRLHGLGYPHAQVADPDGATLTTMLLHLPPALGRLALFGLLIGDHTASPTARRYAAELLDALDLGSASTACFPATCENTPAPLPAPRDWTAIRQAADRLTSDATALAARLRREADRVQAGTLPAEAHELAADLAAFTTALAQVLVDAGRADADGARIGSLAEVRERAERADRDEQERRKLLAERDELAQRLAEVDGRLSALAPATPAVAPAATTTLPTPATPAPVTPAPATQRAGSVGTVPSPAADTPRAPVVTVPPQPDLVPVPVPRAAQPEPAQPATTALPPAVIVPAPAPHIPASTRPAPEPAELLTDEVIDDPEAALELAFPWDPWEDGKEPLVVGLVGDGRLAEAYWLTAAAEETPVRRDVLRFAHAAFTTRDAAAAGEVLGSMDVDTGDDREAGLVAAAALLRCSLAAGWTNRYPQLDPDRLGLPAAWHDLLAAASVAVQHQCRIDTALEATSGDPETVRGHLGETVRKLRDELPGRRNIAHRGTRAQQYMLRHDEPLGELLGLVIGWADGESTYDELRAALDRLSGPDAAEALIDRADAATRSPNQREPIHSKALDGLRRTVDQVLGRAHEAVALATQLQRPRDGAAEARRALHEAATAALHAEPSAGVGGAALALLARWVEKPVPADPDDSEPAADDGDDVAAPVPTDVLLVLADLPRDADRLPVLDDPCTRRELARLIDQLDADDAFARYCERGALDLADRLLQQAPVSSGATRLKTAQKHWRDAVVRLRDDTEALLDRLRVQNLVPDTEQVRIAGRLAADPPDGRAAYDVTDAVLRADHAILQARLRAGVDTVRVTARAQLPDGDVRTRVEALLDEGDVTTAQEFLAIHRAGGRIPVKVGDPAAVLREFCAGIEAGAGVGADARAWAAFFSPEGAGPREESVEGWLDAWAELATAGQGVRRPMERVLRLLGLNPTPNGTEELRLQRAFVTGFTVTAEPRERSLIAELGSGARGRYHVLVVRDERRGRSPLDDVDPAAVSGPTVVLYLHPLGQVGRAAVVDDAKARGIKALVVDPAVVGWLAARTPGSFRATQQLTLPWSIFEHYQPFVAGPVPVELFAGRQDEQARIVAPTGGLFVYGGRQLGKSALLRHIEDAPGDHLTVVYLDLMGLGIGAREPTEQFWAELASALRKKQVLPSRAGVRTPKTIAGDIATWLEEDDARRLLVLADEADAFLTADAEGVRTRGGIDYFPQVSRIKELMERTDRRFKVVFAGLHQVQRFRHLANVPTAHGGREILVGPLDPVAAVNLVVEPLAAFGYTFERPELAWRLLGAANYQPASIQILCAELLAGLRRSQAGSALRPVVITADDVRLTVTSRQVREAIVERMRWTLNLDSRYRVLALIIARQALEHGFATGYATADLLIEAAEVWPEGFDGLDEHRLAVYLNEMEGLGLLVRQADGQSYAMRSPNVVRMLGDGDSLERELAAADFELPYEYNPRLSRRALPQPEPGEPQGRSPLTDAELHDLVAAARTGGVPVVTGTEALTVDRLPVALRGFLQARGESVVGCTDRDVDRHLTAEGAATGTWLVIDLRRADADRRDEVLDRARRSPDPVVALLDPMAAAQQTGTVVRPQRWTAESLRSWPGCPYDTPALRRHLIHVTGGWPDVVELAVQQAQQSNGTTERALAALAGFPQTVEQAERFLTDTGMDAELRNAVRDWALLTEPGEWVPAGHLAEVLDLDAEQAARLVSRLWLLGVLTERPEGVALDELTHRCLCRLVTSP